MLVRKKTLIFFIFCCAFSLQTTAQKSETKNICSGTSTTLTATTGDSYLWSPGGATTSSVTVSPTATTNYTCAVTTNGTTFNTGNLILGGDFEFTIPTGFIMGSQLKLTGSITDPITNIPSDLYTQMNNFGSGMTSETAGLLDIGGAMTTTDPYLLKDTTAASDCGGSYFIHLEDHTKANGTGKMLAIDGSRDAEIWRSGNMNIKPGKTYQFSCWVANIDAQFGTSASHFDPITGTTIITSHDINTLAELTFKIETGNGSSTFPTFTVSQTVGNWTEYTGTYTVPGTGPSTWCNISLTNSTADPDGNDFAIDDIYFGLEQSTSPVTITDNFTVNVDTKATISMANITDCANKNTTLSATVTGGTNNTIAWTKNSAATAGTTNSLPITVPATIGNTDTYTISVTSGVCSAVTSSATVKAISCTSNQKDTICSNTTLVLNSSNTNTYTGISWTPSTGLSDASNATPTFTPTSSGDFQFIMTGTNTSTSTTETITVNVNVQEPATVSLANQTVCENSAVTLAATVSGGTNNIITWTQNGTSITGSTSSISSIAPTVGNTDTYRITITPTGVCPAVFDEGTVSGISCSSIENDTICLNSSVILNNSNTNTYTGISWTPTTGLSDASNATPTFTPTSSGDFQFIMTGTNTSTSTTETITVNVNVKDCGITTVIDTTVCAKDSIIVGPQIYRTSGSYSYTFVGGSQLGADSTVIVNLTVVEINIIAPKTEICIGESLSLQGSANNNLTWTAQWTALPTELGINSSTAKTTAVNGTTDGNFDVTLSASVTKSGSVILATPLVCTAKIPITVHSNPVISEIFTTGRNATIILSTNEGTAPFTYTIDNEDYIVSSLSDLAIGEHSVEITDAEGCKTSGIFNIVPVPIIPAKFFSPNGDGVNDRWVVKGIDFYPGAIIQIFDRFGKELISYHGYDLGWDGTYDGKMMMTTDYWYLITIDEITKVISGHFTLKK